MRLRRRMALATVFCQLQSFRRSSCSIPILSINSDVTLFKAEKEVYCSASALGVIRYYVWLSISIAYPWITPRQNLSFVRLWTQTNSSTIFLNWLLITKIITDFAVLWFSSNEFQFKPFRNHRILSSGISNLPLFRYLQGPVLRLSWPAIKTNRPKELNCWFESSFQVKIEAQRSNFIVSRYIQLYYTF